MALSVQEEDENALVMASLVLNKKAGFIDKKNVMEILKTLNCRCIKVLLSCPFWRVVNVLQYMEMKWRSDYTDLNRQSY